MKVLHMEQGTPEWLHARMAIPTASCFDQILSPKKLQPSTQATKYRNILLAEWVLGFPLDVDGSSGFMERGKVLEPTARAWYELQRNVEVQTVGLVLRDDELVACSPDGLVGDDGGTEIKCPSFHTMIGYLLNPQSLADEYHGQVQGNLYITGRKWWDIIAYTDDLPPVVVRVQPDPAYQEAIHAALGAFVKNLLQCRAMLEPHRQAREAAVREAQAEAREGWAA